MSSSLHRDLQNFLNIFLKYQKYSVRKLSYLISRNGGLSSQKTFSQFCFLKDNFDGDDKINLKARNKLLSSQYLCFSAFVHYQGISRRKDNIFILLGYLMYKRHKNAERQLYHDNVKTQRLFKSYFLDLQVIQVVDASQLVNCRLRIGTIFPHCDSDSPPCHATSN